MIKPKVTRILSIAILGFALIGCQSLAAVDNTAPGQAKKTIGTKSAKSLAPGQVKKATGEKSAKSADPGQKKKKKN